jgi:hypothetical protein
VLFDRGRREPALQLLDEGGDVERLNLRQLVEAVGIAPAGEAARGVEVGFARVVVVDLRGEKKSTTRRAAFGVGANSRAGTRPGAGEGMRAVVIMALADVVALIRAPPMRAA